MSDMRRREFTRCSAAPRRGRSQRASSKPSACGASACLPAFPRTTRKHWPAVPRSCRDLGNWDGTSDATCKSITAWGAVDARRYAYAAELVALAPEVILAVGATVVGPLLAATRSVPVVFVQVTDPVGSGFVTNLARPGGNATGFTLFEFGIGAKWIELLKEIAPSVTRAAVLLDNLAPTGFGQLGAIQSVAPSFGVEIRPINIRDAAEMESAVAAFARGSNAGMIVLPGTETITHRELITTLAARHKLSAVYPYRYFVSTGGLICYGPDELQQHRQAAGYIDRILKGEKPADLPVQAPTKYELVINLKTAKALGIELPATVLARADEVIE